MSPPAETTPAAAKNLLENVLRDVSRSFFLTLRVLPSPVRAPIGLAYLLARTSDTLADSGASDLPVRLEALDRFSRMVRGEDLPAWLPAIVPADEAEQTLLRRLPEMTSLLRRFDAADQKLIQEVLGTIASGQRLDLERFGAKNDVTALAHDGELEDYIFRVAGCVGLFWSQLCRVHLFPKTKMPGNWLEQAAHFGKGLQLVNILRDLPADLRKGRCYIPADKLKAHQLAPRDLLDPNQFDRFQPVYHFYLDRAEQYLEQGWLYTNAIPFRQFRVRLACAWPLLLGIRTLAKLRSARILDPDLRIKVSRPEVKSIVRSSLVACAVPFLWKNLWAKAHRVP